MSHRTQLKIPVTYMRGGTSKGVFFSLEELPENAKVAGKARDNLLLRVIGSPDPYGKQTDGMGGATSSTSKAVDWSGNCGNLSAAVGSFAIQNGLVEPDIIPENGIAMVRIWQANIGKTIIAHVPITAGDVQETGDFELDGVTFPAAEIQLDFLDPGAAGDLFPTGNLIDDLTIPGIGTLKSTMINAGIPTIFVNASDIGFTGSELQSDINNDPEVLARFEIIRAHGAVRMGLIQDVDEAVMRLHTPKIAFVAKPSDYVASSGKQISATDIDLQVRALSMGLLHHAMMGTAAVAIATAAAIPGTLVNTAAGGGKMNSVRFGHPSGTLQVGAAAKQVHGNWMVEKAIMSRSARVLMEGWVRVPADYV